MSTTDRIWRTTCTGCGEDVLHARVKDEVVLLDVREVLRQQPCPSCKAARSSKPRTGCWECGGTQTIGEPLPERAVALTMKDVAGWLHGEPMTGWAVHRLHECAGAAVLTEGSWAA